MHGNGTCVSFFARGSVCYYGYSLSSEHRYYHTSNSRECMGVNGEALQLHSVYKKPYFLLQVVRESVSGTASHAHCIWTCNEIEGSYDKIINTIVATKLYWKKISLVCCRWHCYSCCAIVTIQTATNLWYFPVQLRTMVIIQYSSQRYLESLARSEYLWSIDILNG